jgi:hypothetical protein
MRGTARSLALIVAVVSIAACQFKPTAPFNGFDGQGSRLTGRFAAATTGGGALSLQSGAAATAATANVQAIVVLIRERPAVRATVDQNGEFTLTGIPSGSFTLVFELDGRTIGEIRLRDVRQNQGITITVVLTAASEVVLTEEQRDHVSFTGECPRGPGFWCQNRNGQNPNLSAAEFEEFAEKAALLLNTVPTLDTADEVAAAVCNTGNQFERHLASLALNLAAETVESATALTPGEPPYLTVGDAFTAAVGHLAGTTRLSRSEQERLKDVMDRINNAQNVEGCSNQLPEDEGDDDEETTTPPPSNTPPPSGQLTICHIPPGNYNARQTLTIGASAWPAHRGHCAQGTCDSVGACQ